MPEKTAQAPFGQYTMPQVGPKGNDKKGSPAGNVPSVTTGLCAVIRRADGCTAVAERGTLLGSFQNWSHL